MLKKLTKASDDRLLAPTKESGDLIGPEESKSSNRSDNFLIAFGEDNGRRVLGPFIVFSFVNHHENSISAPFFACFRTCGKLDTMELLKMTIYPRNDRRNHRS